MSVLHQGQPPSYQEARILGQVQIAPAPAAGSDSKDENVGNTPALITVNQGTEVDPTIEEHKQVIYRHPLFPLMAMLFEKCELASSSLDFLADTDYDNDIQTFIEIGQQKNQTFYTDDSDLDNMMLKAIQVMRIHLLELDKVSELCKDFCMRYITCLKGKLQSEHLLRLDDLDSPPLSPASGSGAADWNSGTSVGGVAANSVVNPVGGGMMVQPGLAMATISQGQIISGNMVYQMVHTPQGIVAQPIQIQASPLQNAVGTTPVIQGNTPLSQIGMTTPPVTTQSSTVHNSIGSLSADDSFDDDDPLGKKRNSIKRGVLPKQATQVMKSWLFQHLVHPYPTEDEKRQISSQTNLTLLQVNNWFINARRRILQPMLDSGSTSASSESKVKKSKPVTRPQQRFWPSAIANIQPQLPPHLQKVSVASSSSSSALSGGSIGSSSSPPPANLVGVGSTVVTGAVTANGQVVMTGGTGGSGLTLVPSSNFLLASPSLSQPTTITTATSSSSSSAASPITVVTAANDSLESDSLVLSFNSDPSSGE